MPRRPPRRPPRRRARRRRRSEPPVGVARLRTKVSKRGPACPGLVLFRGLLRGCAQVARTGCGCSARCRMRVAVRDLFARALCSRAHRVTRLVLRHAFAAWCARVRVEPRPSAQRRRLASPIPIRGRDRGRSMLRARCRAHAAALSAMQPFCARLLAQCSRWPGFAPESGDSRNASPSPPAATTMPSLMPNFICRGARLATMTTRRPTSCSGW